MADWRGEASGKSNVFLTGWLEAALKRLQSIGGDGMTVQQVLALLRVASHPGITIQQLAEDLDQSQSTATRNADILGDYGRGPKEGANLLERRVGADRRVRELYLTTRGERLMEALVRLMGSEK